MEVDFWNQNLYYFWTRTLFTYVCVCVFFLKFMSKQMTMVQSDYGAPNSVWSQSLWLQCELRENKYKYKFFRFVYQDFEERFYTKIVIFLLQSSFSLFSRSSGTENACLQIIIIAHKRNNNSKKKKKRGRIYWSKMRMWT